MTNDELLIRQAITAEAEQAVDPGVVLATLRRGRKPRRTRTLVVAVAGLAVAAGIVAVVVPLTAGREQTPPATQEVAPPVAAEQTVLLMGMDAGGERPDSVVLARFGVDGSFRAVSLPRDSRVSSDLRLNAVFSTNGGGDAGAQATVVEVEKLTGVRAQHYAMVDMAGFAALSSAVGGVEVCLKAATKDPYANADFKAGKQVVSGERALSFLRQRHGLPMGDLDRIARHQVFLRALIAKVSTEDATRLAALAPLLRQHVRTDPGLDLIDMARRLAKRPSVAIATVPWSEPKDGVAFINVDPAAARQFTADLFADKPSTPTQGAGDDGCVN
jgi:LCP family protein required for cell wall assembly